MKAPYSGNARPFVLVLLSPADRNRVMPLLEQLDRRGYALCGYDGKATAAQAKRACAAVAFLSAGFAADEGLQATLHVADAAGVPLLPVQLDDSEQPELVRRALMATNAIMAERYESAEALANRLCSADALTNPQVTDAQKAAAKRTTSLLAAAAVCVLVVAAVLLSRVMGASEDVSETADVAARYGMTEEDLAKIRDIVIVGDHLIWVTPESEDYDPWRGEDGYPTHWDYASHTEDENGTVRWYWNEDGSETQLTEYDLSFLTLLPKLSKISLVNVDLASVPSFAELDQLETVYLYSDELPEGGLAFLEGSSVKQLDISNCDVDDFAPLSACEQLEHVYLDAVRGETLDLTGFAPPALGYLNVEQPTDTLEDLSRCTHLSELAIRYSNSDIDLDFLEGMESLETFELDSCENVTDLSALASCVNLRTLGLSDAFGVTDFSFLDSLTKLTTIDLFGCDIRDFDFLAGLESKGDMHLGFAVNRGDADFSGLANITSFDYLHVNGSDHDFTADILPYFKDSTVDYLELYECDGVNLADLPKIFGTLKIELGDLTNLDGLNQPYVNNLQLYQVQGLTSLEGIEGAGGLFGSGNAGSKLEVLACPRLSDWSALKGRRLNRLELKYLYELPDFALLDVNEIRLEGIQDLADLACFDALGRDNLQSVELVGLDEIKSLAPLARLRNSGTLAVPPQLAEQAEALVEDGTFAEWRVEYPDGDWDPSEGGVELLSLDDLDTLPPSLLARVEQVRLAGDDLFDWHEGSFVEWDGEANDGQGCMVEVDEATGERTSFAPGTLTDLTRLEPLTGLRELTVLGQPLTSLDGLEAMQSLERLEINYTWEVEDFSAVFALPNLKELTLPGVNLTSIQGIQNLTELEEVTLSWNDELDDLTPLLELPNLRHVRVSDTMEKALESIDGADYDFELEIEKSDNGNE